MSLKAFVIFFFHSTTQILKSHGHVVGLLNKITTDAHCVYTKVTYIFW